MDEVYLHGLKPHAASALAMGHPARVYLLALCAGVGGLLFGFVGEGMGRRKKPVTRIFVASYDTGVVSGAMLLVKKDFGLTTLQQELIVSLTVGRHAGGMADPLLTVLFSPSGCRGHSWKVLQAEDTDLIC